MSSSDSSAFTETLSASASPTPPPTSSQNSSSSSQSNPTANATLYLYTFLATLVLLLAVSSAIVVRSLMLRRRHQRLVEEAIRTGAWPPDRFDSTTGRRRRDVGQKPKLWEAWLHNRAGYDDDGENEKDGKSRWGDMMPVYAAYVASSTSSPQGLIVCSTENPAEPLTRPPRLIRPFTRRRSPTLPSSQPNVAASSMESQAVPTPALPSTASSPSHAVRVAVLIAMPSQSGKTNCSDESGPPVMEIGVAQVHVKDPDGSGTSSTTGDDS